MMELVFNQEVMLLYLCILSYPILSYPILSCYAYASFSILKPIFLTFQWTMYSKNQKGWLAMDKRIRFVLKYLNDNPGKKVTLNQVSRMVNLSYGYMSGLFKRETGVSFSEYLKEVRMGQARCLLQDTFKSIKEIAFLTGYKYVSSFCEAFRNTVGVSPSVYRRMGKAIADAGEKATRSGKKGTNLKTE